MAEMGTDEITTPAPSGEDWKSIVDRSKKDPSALDVARDHVKETEKQLHERSPQLQEAIDMVQEKMLSVPDAPQADISSVKKPQLQMSKGFIIAAMALLTASVAGAAYMRLGARGAMSALNGALTGLKEGKEKEYEQNMKEYHDKIAMMIKSNDQHNKERDSIRKLYKDDAQMMLIELNRLERRYDTAEKGLVHTLEQLNAIAARGNELTKKLKNQAFIKENALTTEEKKWRWTVHDLADYFGKTDEEMAKIFRPHMFQQMMHPDIELGRGVKKIDKQLHPPDEALQKEITSALKEGKDPEAMKKKLKEKGVNPDIYTWTGK